LDIITIHLITTNNHRTHYNHTSSEYTTQDMLSILSSRCLCGEEEPRKQLTKLDIGTPSNFVHVASHTQVKRFQTYTPEASLSSLSSSSSGSIDSQNKNGKQNIVKNSAEHNHNLNNTYNGVNLQISCKNGSSNSFQTDSGAASSCGEEAALPSSNEEDSLSSTGNINIGNTTGEDLRTIVRTTPTPTIKPLPSPTIRSDFQNAIK